MRFGWPRREHQYREPSAEREYPRWEAQPSKIVNIWREARSESWVLYASAVPTGILFTLVLLFITPHPSYAGSLLRWRHPPSPTPHSNLVPWPDPQCLTPARCWALDSDEGVKARNVGLIRPGFSTFLGPEEPEWSLDQIRDMVTGTKGFYARDWSVNLGWNNMRYIIETGMLHAKLLNRTLVIPSYVYARSCEWDWDVCSSFATFVNRADRVDEPTWKTAPLAQQIGWIIPIEIMLNLNVLRAHVPTITVPEYLALQGLNTSLERTDGKWDPITYHGADLNTTPSSSIHHPTLSIVKNSAYDTNLIRVDRLTPLQLNSNIIDSQTEEGRVLQWIKSNRLDRFRTMTLSEAKHTLLIHGKEKDGEKVTWEDGDDEGMEKVLSRYGLGVIHTFAGRSWNPEKTVIEAETRVGVLHEMRGFIDDFGDVAEEVLWVQGELHDYRVPGSLYFTTPQPRDDFARLVLKGLVHNPMMGILADAVAAYMVRINGGRMWMAAHWRRGDFVKWHLALGGDSYSASISRILARLRGEGLKRLRLYAVDQVLQLPQVPGVKVEPDLSFVNMSAPDIEDKWFLATDERSPQALAYARAQNGILLSDVIINVPHLRRLVGWPLLITDVLAQVEQEVMARAAFFFAHYRSSLAGGVVNMRALRGMDPRNIVLDN